MPPRKNWKSSRLFSNWDLLVWFFSLFGFVVASSWKNIQLFLDLMQYKSYMAIYLLVLDTLTFPFLFASGHTVLAAALEASTKTEWKKKYQVFDYGFGVSFYDYSIDMPSLILWSSSSTAAANIYCWSGERSQVAAENTKFLALPCCVFFLCVFRMLLVLRCIRTPRRPWPHTYDEKLWLRTNCSHAIFILRITAAGRPLGYLRAPIDADDGKNRRFALHFYRCSNKKINNLS